MHCLDRSRRSESPVPSTPGCAALERAERSAEQLVATITKKCSPSLSRPRRPFAGSAMALVPPASAQQTLALELTRSRTQLDRAPAALSGAKAERLAIESDPYSLPTTARRARRALTTTRHSTRAAIRAARAARTRTPPAPQRRRGRPAGDRSGLPARTLPRRSPRGRRGTAASVHGPRVHRRRGLVRGTQHALLLGLAGAAARIARLPGALRCTSAGAPRGRWRLAAAGRSEPSAPASPGTAERIRWELGVPGCPCLLVHGRERVAA